MDSLCLPRNRINPVFLHDFCIRPIFSAQLYQLNETFGLLTTLERPYIMPSSFMQIDHLEASVLPSIWGVRKCSGSLRLCNSR